MKTIKDLIDWIMDNINKKEKLRGEVITNDLMNGFWFNVYKSIENNNVIEFQIYFFKDFSYISPTKDISFTAYYKDEPMILDLFNLLYDLTTTLPGIECIDLLNETRQDIVLRSL